MRVVQRDGLTLLEVMVALVILGLVGVAILEVFGGSIRAAGTTTVWSQAVAYAEEKMEQAKLAPLPTAANLPPVEELPGGFERWVEADQWSPGLRLLTVFVTMPGGSRFEVSRLVRSQ